jgi:hypothetical protein
MKVGFRVQGRSEYSDTCEIDAGGPGQQVEAHSGFMVKQRALEGKKKEIKDLAERMNQATDTAENHVLEDGDDNFAREVEKVEENANGCIEP